MKIGDRVRLTKSIWDDGEDHHPPGWIALMDEIVVVREIYKGRIAVSHEGVEDSSFIIYDEEYDLGS